MITRYVILAIASLPLIPASPLSFGTAISTLAIACATVDTFGPVQPPLIGGAHTSSAGPCQIDQTTQSASATAAVDPLGFTSQISGNAFTQGAADAVATATYFDTVNLVSPKIDYTGGVSVLAGDNYSLSLSGSNLASGAGVALRIQTINQEPAPSSYFDEKVLKSAGSASGQLSIDFTILACPCSFVFYTSGSITTGPGPQGGAESGSFSDPFFIKLPQGWTYTLASHEAAAVPETAPAPLVIVGLVLMLAATALRRLRRTVCSVEVHHRGSVPD